MMSFFSLFNISIAILLSSSSEVNTVYCIHRSIKSTGTFPDRAALAQLARNTMPTLLEVSLLSEDHVTSEVVIFA